MESHCRRSLSADQVPGGARGDAARAGGAAARGAGARLHRAPPGQARAAHAVGAVRGGARQRGARRRHPRALREVLPHARADPLQVLLLCCLNIIDTT